MRTFVLMTSKTIWTASRFVSTGGRMTWHRFGMGPSGLSSDLIAEAPTDMSSGQAKHNMGILYMSNEILGGQKAAC